MHLGWMMTYARVLPCVCFLGMLFAAPVPEGTEVAVSEDPFPALWARAEAMRLWDHPVWWTLGHYHRTMWLRVESRVDDPRFFLAERGKVDRRAELRETLRQFTQPDPALARGERSLACRFPARRRWLQEVLEMPETAFGSPDCESYAQVMAQLGLTQATVVYPSAYMNSPASMFGHLLLVLDRAEKNRLLSRAVNYAAIVEDSFGPLFAFKGIFGLYDGVFAILPYAEKVEEYSAVNRRDIWEYPLALDADAFDRMLRHVWELQELRSRYFFLKENCAFNLLYPVEAARPELRLTRRFRAHAVPVGILRELTQTGVTQEPVFRPSKSTQMAHLASLLDGEGQRRALALGRGAAVPDAEDTAVVLSLAVEIAQFDYTERRISPEVYRERALPLMRERSRRGRVVVPPVPVPEPPHLAHGPRRVGVYAGRDRDGAGIVGGRFRVAYHDWLDLPRAMPPGAEITFLEVDVRADQDAERWHLHQLTVVEIRSLTPHTLWARPLSWAGLLQVEEDPLRPEHHRTRGSFATGRTWAPAERGLLILMLENTLLADSRLDAGVAWEPGVLAGAQYAGERLRAGVRLQSRWGVLGSSAVRHQFQAETRYAVTDSLSLGLRLQHRIEARQDVQEQLVTLMWTF